MSEITHLENHFLIAMPGMTDPLFSQAVVYICEHSPEGAVGILINRPMAFTLGQVLTQISVPCQDPAINSIPVLYGGPVQQERGFVIHRPSGEWGSSIVITDNIAITTSRDILQAIAQKKGPGEMIIALGYASWMPGQLEDELSKNMWLSGPISPTVLFTLPFEQRWAGAAALLGVDITLLSQDIGHA